MVVDTFTNRRLPFETILIYQKRRIGSLLPLNVTLCRKPPTIEQKPLLGLNLGFVISIAHRANVHLLLSLSLSDGAGTNLRTELFLLHGVFVELLAALRGPYLPAPYFGLDRHVFLQVGLDQRFEVEDAALTLGVQRSLDVDARVEVLLDAVHQVVVLEFDALEKVGRALENVHVRSRVPKCLVFRGDRGRTRGDDTHDEEVRRRQVHRGVGVVVGEGSVAEILKVFCLDVVSVRGEMFETAIVRLDGISVQVGDLGDARVACLAVVTLGR